MPKIDLRTPLGIRSSFRFPLQSRLARREILIGAAWLLVPVLGWLLNMGHRIRMVHNLHHGRSAWPSWSRPLDLLKHGAITFLGMVYYGAPGGALIAYGQRSDNSWAMALGGLLCLAAILAIPGYMSHYCRALDPAEIFNPFRALSRATQSGRAYWHAWAIALLSLALSFVGLLVFGVGF